MILYSPNTEKKKKEKKKEEEEKPLRLTSSAGGFQNIYWISFKRNTFTLAYSEPYCSNGFLFLSCSSLITNMFPKLSYCFVFWYSIFRESS